MKNRIHLSLLLTAALVFLSACVKDELDASCRDDKGQFQLTLSIGDQEDVAITRSIASPSECHIHDLYLLVFDASTGFYKFGEQVVLRAFLTGNGTATPKVTSNLVVKAGDKVVVLANTGQTATTVPLTVGVSTVADINAAFPSGNVIGTGTDKKWGFAPSSDGDKRPMSGEFVYTSPLQVQTCNLRSSVAKINVVFDPDLQDATGIFATSNIWFTVANSANYGHVYASPGTMSIPTSGMTFGTHPRLTRAPLSYSGPSAGYGGPLLSRYIPEYNSSVRAKDISVTKTEFHKDRMCIILHVHINKSTTTLMYYRLDIATGNTAAETKEFLNIERNKHYMVTIKKVKSMGYTTPEEALSSPGSNLEYEIKATGDDDNVIVSNGQYALSLDYDEVIYTGDASTEVSFGQICGVDVVGAGLPATKTITASSGVTLTGATSISTTKQELKAKMNGTTGTITVKLGNIVREIKLICNNVIIPASGKGITVMGDYSNVWIKQHPDLRIVANNTTSMTLSVNENVMPTNDFILSNQAEVPIFNSRRVEGYILRAGSTPGRTKVIVDQTVPLYIGWFGGDPNNSNDSRYSKRLIIDSHDLPAGVGQWYKNQDEVTFVNNKETGLDNTKALMTLVYATDYQVAHYCYMLNDRNRNGIIDAGEPIDWYLASQNQLMSVWVTKEGLNTSFTSATYYWSSSEGFNPSKGTAIDLNFKNGYGSFQYKATMVNSVRCCRDL